MNELLDESSLETAQLLIFKEEARLSSSAKMGRIVNEVYFIPNLRSNIISIGQLTKEGNKVMIRREFMWVFDKEEKILMKIKRS